MMAALVERSRREQAKRSWERMLEAIGGRDAVEQIEGIPVEVLAYDYDAGRVEYGYEQWEEQYSSDPAGAPPSQPTWDVGAIKRALDED